MAVEPTLVPVTTPEVETEPIPGLTLLHVPPDVASLSVVVAPPQTDRVPVIAAGCSQIVTGAALFQKSPASAAEL